MKPTLLNPALFFAPGISVTSSFGRFGGTVFDRQTADGA